MPLVASLSLSHILYPCSLDRAGSLGNMAAISGKKPEKALLKLKNARYIFILYLLLVVSTRVY